MLTFKWARSAALPLLAAAWTMGGCGSGLSDGSTQTNASNVDNGSNNLGAPGKACPAIARVPGLSIRFTPDSAWPAGSYVFKVLNGTSQVTCSGTIPVPSGSDTFTCSDQSRLKAHATKIVTSGPATGSPSAPVSGTVEPLPPAEHGFDSLFLVDATGAQKTFDVTVTVEKDGKVLSTTFASASYVTDTTDPCALPDASTTIDLSKALAPK